MDRFSQVVFSSTAVYGVILNTAIVGSYFLTETFRNRRWLCEFFYVLSVFSLIAGTGLGLWRGVSVIKSVLFRGFTWQSVGVSAVLAAASLAYVFIVVEGFFNVADPARTKSFNADRQKEQLVK